MADEVIYYLDANGGVYLATSIDNTKPGMVTNRTKTGKLFFRGDLMLDKS